ncbi:MAG: acetate--CoA ligase family protein [Theionarchaea archaeon]|nr:acetate--CoA ligase family protein [Theionarchaea archaeon]
MKTIPDIHYLFEPRGIAVIGASHDADKVGYKVLENIILGGYEGAVYPVNPKGGTILDHTVYTSIEDIDGDIDVAIIIVPGKIVFDVVKACVEKKVKFLPIISSGFSEVGNVELENQIAAFAHAHGMRILGPNIFGLFSAKSSLNATFGPRDIVEGNVAIITQSGALGSSMIGKTAVENIGLSAMVSVGNKADIDEADLLRYLLDSDGTKVILMYIEGVKQGDRLIHILNEGTKKKPIVVIKSGRSKRGALAAASHTGSLAGADEIFDAIMRQCGVLRAENLEEAFAWCKYLADAPLPQGENTIIITNGGGLGVLATDACEQFGVELYDDIPLLKEIFSPVTPDFGSTKNPIDITGQARSLHYESALKAALAHDAIHAVIALYCETAMFDLEGLGSIIKTCFHEYKNAEKPVVFSLLGGEMVESVVDSLKEKGIPVFSEVYDCVSCLGVLYSHYHHSLKEPGEIPHYSIDFEAINTIIASVIEKKRYFLLAHEAQAVMEAAGIPIPKSFIARNLQEAVHYAEDIGYPVVMKVVSKDIIHKSDVGGVALDLETRDEVVDAYQAIVYNCRTHEPTAAIEGMDISEMVHSGIETIIGARQDQSFGPIVMFGLGGIYVEVMKDVSFRAYPLDISEALNMMKETRSYPLLLGVRGEEKKDIHGVAEVILKLGAVIENCPFISDIEINPLVVYEYGRGVKAVDVRILLSKSEVV